LADGRVAGSGHARRRQSPVGRALPTSTAPICTTRCASRRRASLSGSLRRRRGVFLHRHTFRRRPRSHGRVLIGADGIHSVVRDHVGAGPPILVRQVSWRGLAPARRPPAGLGAPPLVLGTTPAVRPFYVSAGQLVNWVGNADEDDWQEESGRREATARSWPSSRTGTLKCAAWHRERSSGLFDRPP
jgi:2-polyprenyl-6-methoxyphenol hydroxylase-like FAD-dependent oxidoreductase